MRTAAIGFAMVFITLSAVGQQLATRSHGLINESRVGPYTYGTASETVFAVNALAFRTWNSSTTDDWNVGRYITGGSVPEFLAPITLPEGAVVTAIELDACDTSSTGRVQAFLTTCQSPSTGCSLLGAVETGALATPGCNLFYSTVNPNTIDNLHSSYVFEVYDTIDGAATKFNAVRVYYKLQVSPPPLTATFNDVPTTHLFYQYVEALAAAGITAGCGGGNYCPDASVTRGQMAVFLAKALGLHWPN